jgi:hypothetical protein
MPDGGGIRPLGGTYLSGMFLVGNYFSTIDGPLQVLTLNSNRQYITPTSHTMQHGPHLGNDSSVHIAYSGT